MHNYDFDREKINALMMPDNATFVISHQKLTYGFLMKEDLKINKGYRIKYKKDTLQFSRNLRVRKLYNI